MSDVYVIRIDPSGAVTDCEGDDLLAIANEWFDNKVDVYTLPRVTEPGMPHTLVDGTLVVCMDEWGRRNDAAVNLKAWALYGRSMIVGVVFVGLDPDDDGTRHPLPPAFIAAVRENWVRRPLLNVEAMRRIAIGEGARWPS